MSIHLSLVVILSACPTLVAQESDALHVLDRVANTYRDLQNESIEATIVLDVQSHRLEVSMTGAIAGPDKVRFEIINPMMGSQTVSDATSVWKYASGLSQYTKRPAVRGVFPLEGPGEILAGTRVMEGLQTAKLLRRESLLVDGVELACDVVEARYAPNPGKLGGGETTKTFWIDRQRSIILKLSSLISAGSSPADRSVEIAQSTTVTSVKLNQPILDSKFVFVAPAGSKEVGEFIRSGMNAAVSGK